MTNNKNMVLTIETYYATILENHNLSLLILSNQSVVFNNNTLYKTAWLKLFQRYYKYFVFSKIKPLQLMVQTYLAIKAKK